MGNKPSYLGRGRKSWTDAPRPNSYGSKWYEEFDLLEPPKNPNKPKEIRPVGGTYTIAMHYVKFKKKDGGMTGFYLVCPDFDSEVGDFKPDEQRTCPICRDFTDSDLPDDLRSYASLRYYTDAFDLERVRKGVQDGCYGVVITNKYGAGDIIKIAETMNGVPVDDEANGVSLHWFNNPKAKDAKDRVSFSKGEKVPVMWSDNKKMFGIKYRGKVFTGTPTDFAEIIEVKSAKELEKDLGRIGLYKKLTEWRRSQGQSAPMESAPSTASSSPEPESFGGDRDFSSGGSDDGFGGGDSFGSEDSSSGPDADWGATPSVEEPPAGATSTDDDWDSSSSSDASSSSDDNDGFGAVSGGGGDDWDSPSSAPADSGNAKPEPDFGDDW